MSRRHQPKNCISSLKSLAKCDESIGYSEEQLLQDPDDARCWTIDADGGDGWLREEVDDDQSEKPFFFASSYDWCRKSQTIDLKALGYSEEFLDSSPEIIVRDFYLGRGDCGSVYELRVELQDEDRRAMQNPFLFSDETVTLWLPVTKRFSGYGKGLRFIHFQHSGKDRNYWKGHFGARVAESSVIFAFPVSYHPENNCISSSSKSLVKCDSVKMKRAMVNLISLWKLSSIDGIKAAEAAIDEQNEEFQKGSSRRVADSAVKRPLRVDLQWVTNGRASVAVISSGHATYARIVVPVDRLLGHRLFRSLLNRSLEASESVEFMRNDGRFSHAAAAQRDARILKSHPTTDVAWIVVLHGSPLRLIGVWRDARQETHDERIEC